MMTYVCESLLMFLYLYIYFKIWLKLEITKSKVTNYITAVLKFITEVTLPVGEPFSVKPLSE